MQTSLEKRSDTKAELVKAPPSGTKWVTFIPFAVCMVLVAWLYFPIFRWWYGNWTAKESYYAHGPLIPLISILILWLRSRELKQVSTNPDTRGYVFVVGVLALAVFGYWLGPESLIGLTFPLLISAMTFLFLGWAMAKELAFPTGFLYFMCVMPASIFVPLAFRIQVLSTIGATAVLRGLTFDVVRRGVIIVMPSITVQVASECSGFRLLIGTVAFAVLAAYLVNGPKWGKAVLLLATLPVTVILNTLRIALVCLVGEYFGENVMHTVHDYSGLVMVAVAFLILLRLARLVKCRESRFTL